MFRYIKEVIINSMTADQDAYGTTLTLPKVTVTPAAGGKPALLSIVRAGEYKLPNIVDATVYRTPGVAGVTGSAALTVNATDFASPGIYRVTVFIGMNNRFLSDFAYANWYAFGRPLLVEFEVTAGMTPAQIAALIGDSLTKAVPYNNVFARVVVAGAVVTVYLTDPYAHIRGVTLDYYEPVGCDSCIGQYVPITITGPLTITANKEPFATAQWIRDNLRFPSYPNVRDRALFSDEYPITGKIYTMYSFNYDVVRHLGGLSVVSQKNESITRHVYYVNNDIVTAWETLLGTFGVTIVNA